MIGHEAVANHFDRIKFGILLKKPEVYVSIRPREENLTPLIPALSDVMSTLRNHNASESGHSPSVHGLRESSQKIREVSVCPGFPRISPGFPTVDALMIGGPQVLDGTFESWTETEPQDRGSILYEIMPDAESKLDILEGNLPNVLVSIKLPNESADATLEGEPEGRTLIEYLRWSFQWGGFPGWEKQKRRPEKELALLRKGLLPL